MIRLSQVGAFPKLLLPLLSLLSELDPLLVQLLRLEVTYKLRLHILLRFGWTCRFCLISLPTVVNLTRQRLFDVVPRWHILLALVYHEGDRKVLPGVTL
jgi:hypothetical protein